MRKGIGRPWEKEKLRLEFVSHGEASTAGIGQSRQRFPNYQQEPVKGGRKHKSDSTPISFVFGEKFHQKQEGQGRMSDNVKDAEEDEDDEPIKAEPKAELLDTEPSSSNNRGEPTTALHDVGWISNSDRGQLLMQMMEKMGYEHGRGLGKSGQGIVEPIEPNPNPGKKALGAAEGHRHSGRRDHAGARSRRRQPWDFEDGESAEEHRNRGIGTDPGRKARMNYEDNVQDSLKAAGFTDASTEEIWRAMGVLAKHKIMPLGMGLGLVKRMVGKQRRANGGHPE